MKILITNDDGIENIGIRLLAEWAKKLGEVTVVAPKVEQSAKSHAIDFTRPIEIKKVPLLEGVILNNTSTTIIQARQARDMSQRDLADEANISYPHMSDIENDKVDMGLDIFKRIATVLEIANRPK